MIAAGHNQGYAVVYVGWQQVISGVVRRQGPAHPCGPFSRHSGHTCNGLGGAAGKCTGVDRIHRRSQSQSVPVLRSSIRLDGKENGSAPRGSNCRPVTLDDSQATYRVRPSY